MKSREIFWGLFFVFFGALLILRNFDIIDFGWQFRDIWRLWPLALVLLGMNLISRRSERVYQVAIIVLTLAFGYLLVYGYQLQHS